MSPYDVVLADPPWDYPESGTGSRTIAAHYPLMSIEAICALPMRDIVSENAALFLWVTFPRLYDAQSVFSAWGFEYKTQAFTWVKLNSNSMGVFTGMGSYTRSNAELCLLGIRGKMPVAAHDVHSVIMSPIQQHSRKPVDQFSRIEKLYPNKNYLEMFARRPRSGWSVFGNEVEGSIRLLTPRAADAIEPRR